MKEIVKSTRGTVHQYNDDSLDFKPYGKGEPVYEHSYKVGEATIGKTKSAKGPNYVAKLKCSADEADPCEVMHQQLDKLADKEWPDRENKMAWGQVTDIPLAAPKLPRFGNKKKKRVFSFVFLSTFRNFATSIKLKR